MLVRLWCLLAVAAIANATSVASRISKHALAANPSAMSAVTRSLRQAAKATRSAPVTAERRGLAESDLTMCHITANSVKCSLSDDRTDCEGKTECKWDNFEGCIPSYNEEAESDRLSVIDEQGSECSLHSDDSSACESEANCEANGGCNPTRDFVDDALADPVEAQMAYTISLCHSIDDPFSCRQHPECEIDNDSCGISDEGMRLIFHALVNECDFEDVIREGRDAAQDTDLCPVAAALLECSQITTESACDRATKCEWASSDYADDPQYAEYPCLVKDEHGEPMLEAVEANYALVMLAGFECMAQHSSESACERDHLCEWNDEGGLCAPKELKLYHALADIHPHFARYYQIYATCGALDERACLNAGDKCVWSEAVDGDETECLPTMTTVAGFMSCECSGAVAAAAATLDTSSVGCAVDWRDASTAVTASTASNCEHVCEGHGYTRHQCLAASSSCAWDNRMCWSGVGPNPCVHYTSQTASAPARVFNTVFAIVTLCAFVLISA